MKRVLLSVLAIVIAGALASPVPAQIDDTPDQPKESAPHKEGVEPVIPLNTADPTYDWWKLARDNMSEGREPGPIDIQRFWGGLGWQGIPTFFRLPVALVPADLEAGSTPTASSASVSPASRCARRASRRSTT